MYFTTNLCSEQEERMRHFLVNPGHFCEFSHVRIQSAYIQ